MNIGKIESVSGKLVSVSSMKQTKKDGRWSIGLLIGENWYNAFGSQETLDRLIAKLEKGNDVDVKFKTNGRFRELLDVRPIVQGVISPPAIPVALTPVESYTVMNPNGTLNITKMQMTLKTIESDCSYLIKELDKVGQAEKEDHSH